ncbi:MAG TPA: phosphoribosylanthranilate isomerase, partial [Longimicrobium sp.]|nr:phosphoribosylanthranilate isomerase [Longimicrobium sp.]
LPARKVGVFVNAPLHELISVTTSVAVDVVQLHGDEPPEYAARVAEAGFEVWKAVRPRDGDEFAAAAERYGTSAHALLLDGFSAAAAGGTGTRFPWEAVAERLHLLPPGVRLVAAGGLNPENVAEAARILRPHVVDVSSGVERETGVKDAEKVRAFVAAARGGGG